MRGVAPPTLATGVSSHLVQNVVNGQAVVKRSNGAQRHKKQATNGQDGGQRSQSGQPVVKPCNSGQPVMERATSGQTVVKQWSKSGQTHLERTFFSPPTTGVAPGSRRPGVGVSSQRLRREAAK
eukprot:5530-Rhodomonas_salina.2